MLTIDSFELQERRVLLRAGLNVPVSEDGQILDDTRIRAALPTIEYVLARGAPCIVMSHLGRPGGRRVKRLSLAPVARRLSELVPRASVRLSQDVGGDEARRIARDLRAGGVLVLENLRFHPGERENDSEFAARLANLGDVYVNDAFAVCHRAHASVNAVPKIFPKDARCAGLLVKREVEALDKVLEAPAHPFVGIFGGMTASDKLDALSSLLERVDRLLVGGALAYTFLKARGIAVGDSKVDEKNLEAARQLMAGAGEKLLLPVDHAVAGGTGPERERMVASENIDPGWAGLDIGPETIAHYRRALEGARSIVWNGPMGKLEEEAFFQGTRAIAQTVARSDATTIVGGGETGLALHQLGLAKEMTHVSTGGGAFLMYIAKGTLPALRALVED